MNDSSIEFSQTCGKNENLPLSSCCLWTKYRENGNMLFINSLKNENGILMKLVMHSTSPNALPFTILIYSSLTLSIEESDNH